MRIPLDYYRILGLPIQATPDQLQQAYRDRALQLPRREYSEVAIASRKRLLDEAYQVLSDEEQRTTYDAAFLGSSQDGDAESRSHAEPQLPPTEPDFADPYSPSLEISDDQLVGALLILQELGEYELVLKLGRPYLSSGNAKDRAKLGDPQLVQPDIVLTLALACLELGREQWQQGQYDNAATSLKTGQELLLKEGYFPSVRGEIQADLYKLRPYCILELLSIPEDEVRTRRRGLQLLQEMLQERGGIDGAGDDQSGLNIDDFLRFIQQLRSYLTVAEQQALFEAEARRPSAVATYLAVYALIARGFAERKPGYIQQAKRMLMRLGKRQDVHLEQAVCALLLGQTEEASRALELSQEYESLAFIREHSQGSPDLLPGLCLYGERWLQNEVFPHFRDLAELRASLKDFFADEQVQSYLENLPVEEETNEWAVMQTETLSGTASSSRSSVSNPPGFRTTSRATWANGTSPVEPSRNGSSTATIERSPVPLAERIAPPGGSNGNNGANPNGSTREGNKGRARRNGDSSSPDRPSSRAELVPVATTSVSVGKTPVRKARKKNLKGLLSGLPKPLALGVVVLGIGIVGFGAIATIGWINRTIQDLSTPPLQGSYPKVKLSQPVVEIPSAEAQIAAPSGPLNNETARQVVQTWLSTKAGAFGKDYNSEKLKEILVNPALSRWERQASSAKANGSYWDYKHRVEVKEVNTNTEKPDVATVDAQVTENAKFYQGGQLNRNQSYDEDLRVRYDLVRQNGQWLIKDMRVVK